MMKGSEFNQYCRFNYKSLEILKIKIKLREATKKTKTLMEY